MTVPVLSGLRLFRRVMAFASVAGVVLLLFVWAATRETAEEKAIQRAIASLRAAGEPIDGADLARMFPDPDPAEDASVLFAKAFAFTTNFTPPLSTPVVMGGTLSRTTAVESAVLDAMIQFCAATAGITNLLPAVVPARARFPMHWQDGVTNNPPFSFILARRFMQLLATHALTAAETGDAEGATRMIEHGFQFARTINYDGLFVTHMIRHGSEGLMCNVTERALARVRFNDSQLARISASAPSENSDDMLNSLRAEHCLCIWAFTGTKNGTTLEELIAAKPIHKPWWQRTWERIKRRRADYRDADFLRYLEMMPKEVALATNSIRQAIAGAKKIYDENSARVISETGEAAFHDVVARVLGRHAEAQTQLSAMKVALAIERFRGTHGGTPPESLEALVPGFLSEVPSDPFGDGSLRFKKRPNGYVVYGLGSDGVDNGGTERTNSIAPANYDVTFTVER